MCNRTRQLDMRHALAAHFCLRNFNTALFAYNATMLQPLVLAAQAFIVLDRAKDLCAEQSVALGFERTVIDGLRLLNLTERPGPDHVGRRKTDANCIKVVYGILVSK